jgi:hypothetical protein
MNDLRERVKREIDTVADNPAYDCVTNRYVATDRILALLAETPGECCCMNGYTSSVCPVHASPPSDQGLRDAAEELLTVADLRGDSDLPHPADDEKHWTARMQTAWDDLRAALASPPSDQGLRDVAQRLLSAIDRAMVEDDDLPDGIDGTLIDDLREALASKKGGTP